MVVHDKYNYLLIYVDNDSHLKDLYIQKANEHNEKVRNNMYPDAGFDLYCPQSIPVYPGIMCMIDLKIKCAMYNSKASASENGSIKKKYLSYYMYPRSSISKTPLRLANSVGIIDSGYRGNLCAAVDNIQTDPFQVTIHQRLFQICSPSLTPLIVKVIDDVDYFEETSRGHGGFGSTGV